MFHAREVQAIEAGADEAHCVVAGAEVDLVAEDVVSDCDEVVAGRSGQGVVVAEQVQARGIDGTSCRSRRQQQEGVAELQDLNIGQGVRAVTVSVVVLNHCRSGGRDRVVGLRPGEDGHVGASSTVDGVVTSLAGDGVAAASAVDRVGVAPAEELVVAGTTSDCIGEVRSLDGVDAAGDGVRPDRRVAGHDAGGEVDGNPARRLRVGNSGIAVARDGVVAAEIASGRGDRRLERGLPLVERILQSRPW